VKGVVLEVIEHDALAEAVVLCGVFNDGLLEVGVEFKDLFENWLAAVAKYKSKEVALYNYLICADKERVARSYLVERVQDRKKN
jgi:hypothetical protein